MCKNSPELTVTPHHTDRPSSHVTTDLDSQRFVMGCIIVTLCERVVVLTVISVCLETAETTHE